MRVVVADQKGIVSAAVRAGFQRKKSPSVEFIRASSWNQVFTAINGQKAVVLVSAQLIREFQSTTALAQKAKEVNPELVFFAYNASEENYGSEVDFAVPEFQRSQEIETPGEWVAEFVILNAMKGVDRTRQMALSF